MSLGTGGGGFFFGGWGVGGKIHALKTQHQEELGELDILLQSGEGPQTTPHDLYEGVQVTPHVRPKHIPGGEET